jgi:hypothetical protein
MRFLLFLAAACVVYLLLRRLVQPTDYSAQHVGRMYHGPDESVKDDVPRLEVIRHYFREIDAGAGPAERDVFYDELFVDVLEPRTRDIWKYSFYVGTPKGVAKAMSEENWDYLFSSELLIVKTFDIDLILRAVIENLEEQHELPRAVAKKGEKKYWA